MEKSIKIFFQSFLILLGLLAFSLTTNAADERLGGFKCSTFAPDGKKLAIFKATTDEETTGDPHFDPKDGQFFCVEVSENVSHAKWEELMNGRNGSGQLVVKREWNSKDVRAQYRDKCANVGGEWDDIDDDHKPSEGKYEFLWGISNRCAGMQSDYDARQRYYFNDLGSEPEVYIFFIKIAATDEQQTNPIPVCAEKNGTSKQVCETNSQCFWLVGTVECKAKADPGIDCTKLPPDVCSAANYCTTGENDTCVKKTAQIEQSKAIDKYISDRYKAPDNYTGPLPDCAFTGSCRNVEDLLQLGVNVANWLFGIIAGLGFAFFVYGGLTMVLSFGNSEKVGQGKQILVAATVGIIIAFSAYVLVSFIVKAIGINPNLVPF